MLTGLSVIGDLGKLSNENHVSLGWLIGRPIVASVAMAIITPIVTKWLFAPLFRKYIEHHFARFDHISNIILMILVLSAFITIAGFTGTSVLFGAFLAGVFLTYLPSKRPEGPFVVMSREEGEREADKSPTFVHTFEKYLLGPQEYLMDPLFFASIGFAIPFVQLWTGKRIWRGVVYTLLMAFAKVFILLPFTLLWAQYEVLGDRANNISSVLSECGYPCGNYLHGVHLMTEGTHLVQKKVRCRQEARKRAKAGTKDKASIPMGTDGIAPGSPQYS